MRGNRAELVERFRDRLFGEATAIGFRRIIHHETIERADGRRHQRRQLEIQRQLRRLGDDDIRRIGQRMRERVDPRGGGGLRPQRVELRNGASIDLADLAMSC